MVKNSPVDFSGVFAGMMVLVLLVAIRFCALSI